MKELSESQRNEPTGGMHNSTIAKTSSILSRWRPEKDKTRSQEQLLCVKRDRKCFSSYIASQVRDADLRASLLYPHINYQSETTEGEETKYFWLASMPGRYPAYRLREQFGIMQKQMMWSFFMEQQSST